MPRGRGFWSGCRGVGFPVIVIVLVAVGVKVSVVAAAAAAGINGGEELLGVGLNVFEWMGRWQGRVQC